MSRQHSEDGIGIDKIVGSLSTELEHLCIDKKTGFDNEKFMGMKKDLAGCLSKLPLLTIYDAETTSTGSGGTVRRDLDEAILEAIFKAGEYNQSILDRNCKYY